MSMPEVPVLSQWDEIDKVRFSNAYFKYFFMIFMILYIQSTLCNSENKYKFCPNSGYCSCTHLIEVDTNDLVEFILVDSTYTVLPQLTDLINKHPMHLHGYKFAVVALHEVDKHKLF